MPLVLNGFLADRSKAFQLYSVNCEKLGHDASPGQFVVFAPEPLELRLLLSVH
jgi:hypothetical protein